MKIKFEEVIKNKEEILDILVNMVENNEELKNEGEPTFFQHE